MRTTYIYLGPIHIENVPLIYIILSFSYTSINIDHIFSIHYAVVIILLYSKYMHTNAHLYLHVPYIFPFPKERRALLCKKWFNVRNQRIFAVVFPYKYGIPFPEFCECVTCHEVVQWGRSNNFGSFTWWDIYMMWTPWSWKDSFKRRTFDPHPCIGEIW